MFLCVFVCVVYMHIWLSVHRSEKSVSDCLGLELEAAVNSSNGIQVLHGNNIYP